MFENFPYTNFHNLNLDWIIEKVKEAYGPDNPPPTFVMSVNGQTGDVIVYPDAVVKLPTVEEATWNIFRFANGTERGVEFSPGEMKRIDGTGRYKIYDEQNPPPYPVISVNGETGNVILYRSAYIALPTVQEATWTIYRISSGTTTGIQFTAEKAQRISGQNRYDIYDAQNPPPYPVTSVNGKTGIVTTPFTNPSESILDLDTDSPGDTWGFARNTLGGKATLYLDTTGNDIKAYIQYISDDETIYKEYPLLTDEDIPESAGVVSVNGEYGVVTVYGSGIRRSSTNAQTIDAALTALETNVSNNSDAITELASITDSLAIVANGDTHPQIASGQFVIVRNHSTLPDGVYKATAAIQTDGPLSTSNLQADGAGGLNALQSQVDSLNSKIASQTANIADAVIPLRVKRSANIVVINVEYVSPTTTVPANTGTLIATLPEGFRPSATEYLGFILVGSTGNLVAYCRVTVEANGKVTIYPSASIATSVTLFGGFCFCI